jgi:hypothetical protein
MKLTIVYILLSLLAYGYSLAQEPFSPTEPSLTLDEAAKICSKVKSGTVIYSYSEIDLNKNGDVSSWEKEVVKISVNKLNDPALGLNCSIVDYYHKNLQSTDFCTAFRGTHDILPGPPFQVRSKVKGITCRGNPKYFVEEGRGMLRYSKVSFKAVEIVGFNSKTNTYSFIKSFFESINSYLISMTSHGSGYAMSRRFADQDLMLANIYVESNYVKKKCAQSVFPFAPGQDGGVKVQAFGELFGSNGLVHSGEPVPNHVTMVAYGPGPALFCE